MEVVNRNSPIPLYEQCVSDLRARINSGQLRPGEAIESEKDLMERYGVSRVTIRQALGQLREENLIISRQGKGTFVAPAKVEEKLLVLKSFSELMSTAGRKANMEITYYGFEIAEDQICQTLGLMKGEEVLKIERLHTVDDQVMAYARIFLPQKFGKEIRHSEVEKRSIYSILEEKFHLELGLATQHIRAVCADRKLASLFGVKKGAPLLLADRTTYSVDDIPVENIRFFYPADQYEFVVNLKRAEKGSLWP